MPFAARPQRRAQESGLAATNKRPPEGGLSTGIKAQYFATTGAPK
jgi:hypothetical protein